MPRGVTLGTKRGRYKTINKAKLRNLARNIIAGQFDREAVAYAFESTKLLPDRLIANQLRAGQEFNPERLARAVEQLSDTRIQHRKQNPMPLWMVKAALRHLEPEYGGKGEPIHAALRVDYPYSEHPKVRAYHRQLVRDYGQRSKGEIERKLNENWPQREPGSHPELERALKESLSGYGVPQEVWRGLNRKRLVS